MLKKLMIKLALVALLMAPQLARTDVDMLEYLPGDVKALQAEGKTVFVDFYTTWCGTCKRQERMINEITSENPAYGEKMVFINVDWDVHASSELSKTWNIPRRSTLVVVRGEKELGRLVAVTGKDEIRALMDLGLKD